MQNVLYSHTGSLHRAGVGKATIDQIRKTLVEASAKPRDILSLDWLAGQRSTSVRKTSGFLFCHQCHLAPDSIKPEYRKRTSGLGNTMRIQVDCPGLQAGIAEAGVQGTEPLHRASAPSQTSRLALAGKPRDQALDSVQCLTSTLSVNTLCTR